MTAAERDLLIRALTAHMANLKRAIAALPRRESRACRAELKEAWQLAHRL